MPASAYLPATAGLPKPERFGKPFAVRDVRSHSPTARHSPVSVRQGRLWGRIPNYGRFRTGVQPDDGRYWQINAR